MKKSIKFLALIAMILLLTSCEKEEENPFIGTWEFRNTTEYSSFVMTMIFRSDMTMTHSAELVYDGETTNTSIDYSYSYTETTITIKEDGEPEETTEYLINDKYLVLAPGNEYEITYTKIN